MASRRAIRAALGSDDPCVSDSLLGGAWSWDLPALQPAVPIGAAPTDTGIAALIDACVDELCGSKTPPRRQLPPSPGRRSTVPVSRPRPPAPEPGTPTPGVPIPVIDDAPTLPHDPALRPLAPRRIRIVRIHRAA